MEKRAVIYARYSCDKQSEQSIEGQIHVINDFAVRNGYTIVSSYIDRAKSAKTANRPQFLQMISDSAKGIFDLSLIHISEPTRHSLISYAVFCLKKFFLMIRRPPRSTHCISSAASDVYKRQKLVYPSRRY